MNKYFLKFSVFLVVAVIVYISLAMWNHQLNLQTTRLSYQHTHYDTVTKRIELRDGGTDKHRINTFPEKTKQDSKELNHSSLKTSVKQTTPSESVVLSGHALLKPASQKYLIYLCHTGLCGGWSDRQRGLVSVYFLALATGRKYGIVMDRPCNITHFYVPNDVSWVIPEAELKGKTSVVVKDVGSKANVQRTFEAGFDERYPQDVVYLSTNNANYHLALARSKLYKDVLPKWAKSKNLYSVFSRSWKTLMKPSQHLQERLDNYLQSIQYANRTRPLVCSHVRFGKSEHMKEDGRTRLTMTDIRILWKFLDPYAKNGSQLFMATDNMEVRKLTRQRYGESMSDSGGTIIHIDRTKTRNDGAACAGFGDAVLDQLILTKCDVFVLSSSGFGERANALRNDTRNVFKLQKGMVRRIS